MTGTNLVNYSEEWAQFAQQYASQVPVTGNGGKTLSLKGGMFSAGDKPEDVIGTRLCAVILDSVAINTYYEGEWVDGRKSTPKCYAYGFPPEEMRPHVESMKLHMDHFMPQTLDANGNVGPCSGCRHNVFGTALKGLGKACQNRDRLALIPAGQFTQQRNGFGYDLNLFDDPKWFASAEIHKLNLPVLSVRPFREYANKVIQQTGRPPWGVFTVISVEPRQEGAFVLSFTMQELVGDHLFTTIRERYLAAHAGMIEPFSPPKEQEQQVQPQPTQRAAYVPPTAQGLTSFGRR